MNAKLVCFYLSAAIALIGAVRPAAAQDPPNVADYIDAATTYHTSNFDYVDSLNHRVALDIPLVDDQSQRGNLNFTYSLRYASTTAWYAVDEGNGWFQWQPANSAVTGPSFSMDGNLRFGYDDYFLCNGGCGYQIANQANDDTGAQHFLGTLSGTQRAPCSFTAESVDGSGTNLVVGSDCTTNLWAYTFTNRQGVQFQGDMTGFGPGYNGGQIEDTNGNLLTFSCANGGAGSYGASGLCGMAGSATQMEDTVGRTWSYSYQVDVSGCPYPAVQANLWQVPGPNGQMRNFTFCYSSIGISTSFGASNIHEYNNGELLITAVIMPDGTSWQFGYDGYGELTSVQLPTGGTVNYSWGGNDAASQPWCVISSAIDCQARAVTLRTSNDLNTNTQSSWQYNGFTVTDPAGNDAVYTPANPNDVADDGRVNSIQYFNGPAANNSLIKTVNYGYQTLDNPYPNDMGDSYQVTYLPASAETQWPNGQTNEVAQTYDFAFTFTDDNDGSQHSGNYGSQTWLTTSDYGSGRPGNVLSRVVSSPEAYWNSSYLSANMLDLPAYQGIEDVNWNFCSLTNYTYDDPNRLFQSGMGVQHQAAPSSVRGNVSSIGRWLSTNQCTSGASGSTLYSYDNFLDTGMLYQNIDARGITTTIGYNVDFAEAYPTQICDPIKCTNYLYDFNTGLVSSMTDANNQQTTYSYDIMMRPILIQYPDSGETQYTYSTYNSLMYALMQRKIDSRWASFYTLYDGLGRAFRAASSSDESNPYNQVDTCYDSRGNIRFQSYPYQGPGFSSAACSTAGDTISYDGINRPMHVTHSDGTVISTAYAGRATCVTDEGNGTQGVERCSQVDGSGREISVCEITSTAVLGTTGTPAACGQDGGGTGFLSTYAYDPMGDLTAVSQGGFLNRSSTYDSLSRVICAANPEMQVTSCPSPDTGSYTAGTTRYSYDSDDNVTQRIRPAPNQTNPAATVTTTYAYDLGNRITQKSYSDGTTPATFYAYDGSGWWGIQQTNVVGRLMEAWTGSSCCANTAAIFGYDPMGRIVMNDQCSPYNCGSGVWPVGYTYDLVGDTTSSTNGVGVALTYSYNVTQRLTGVTSNASDSNHPASLFSGGHYNAAGSLVSAALDAALIDESRTYDGRLRLTGISDTALGSTLYSLVVPTNGYAPDSNLLAANDSVNNNWTYGYDAFNRLASAATTGQSYSYAYDRFGNRWQQNGTHSMQLSFSGNNNHIDPAVGYLYDAVGNLTYDPSAKNGYAYDAENRVISVTNNGNLIASYTYDANGRRVRKTLNSGTLDYVYNLNGEQVLEANSSGGANRDELYAAGRHLATYVVGTTFFNFADNLGTERFRATVGGTVANTCTNLPFGDLQTCTGSVSTMHFTGQEHDSETGLDNFKARYYGNSTGRFLSPDPTRLSMFIDDPQTWNMYTYAHNNPLGYVDRNGKWPTPTHVLINQMALGAYLTPDELKIVNDVSAGQDNPFLGGQFNGVAYEHAMSAPGQSVEDAEAQYNSFVSNEVQAAQEAQIKFWESDPLSDKLSPEALRHFAKALHAVEDSTSPAHAGFQLWNWRSWSLIQRHRAAERNATPQQLQTAVSAAQQLYEQTFGGYDEFDFLSLLQQQEQVTSQIGLSSNSGCSQDEDGNVTCP